MKVELDEVCEYAYITSDNDSNVLRVSTEELEEFVLNAKVSHMLGKLNVSDKQKATITHLIKGGEVQSEDGDRFVAEGIMLDGHDTDETAYFHELYLYEIVDVTNVKGDDDEV